MSLFETARISFKELSREDLDDLYALLSDEEVMRYCGGAVDESGARRWLESAMEAYGRHGYDYWAVHEKATGEFIGQIGIMNQQIEGKSIDCLAYMIARAHWGKGYATEGAAACIKFGFEVLGLEKIYSTVEKGNAQSIHILQKIGMSMEGEIKYFGESAFVYQISKSL